MTNLDSTKLHLVDSVQKAGEFLTWLSQKRPHDAVSVDIETGELPGNNPKDALSPWHGRIRLAQVGDGEQGWAIPWDEWGGVFYEGMNRYEGGVVCHNIAFEAKWFAVKSRWELPWHKADDTMIMARVIQPNAPSAALKVLSSQLVDHRAAALQETLQEDLAKNGWTWGTVPIDFEPYWAYGALDTVITMKLFEQFHPKVRPGSAYAKAYELEMATRRIATRMEVNGARVDLEYSQHKYDELIDHTDRSRKWVMDNYHASISSTQQLIKVFEGMGSVFTDLTPTGLKRLTKEQLDFFSVSGHSMEVRTLADVVLAQRKADKLASSYFLNFLNGNIDGFVHPEINTLGARTGRMSIQNPALQTLPSNDNTVRKAFIPREAGQKIISSDLDQVEFRLTANLSGDKALIDLFLEADATEGDVFTEIMREVYQDPTLDKDLDKDKRGLIKGTVYGKLYGAGVDKMAATAGVPVSQMQNVVDGFDRNYPGVKTLQKQIERIGLQRVRDEGEGYVITQTGRRLPCDEGRVYALTNYLIQASAAEVFKTNLVELDNQDLTEFLLVPVHDEIVLSVPEKEAEEIMYTVKECMTTREGWAVPLTAGSDGPFDNWGGNYKDAK